jgi:hypothetical protein
LDPEVEKQDKAAFLERVRSLVRASEFEEASRWASAHYYETLAGVQKQEMELEFKSNWGETLSIELMMEHVTGERVRPRDNRDAGIVKSLEQTQHRVEGFTIGGCFVGRNFKCTAQHRAPGGASRRPRVPSRRNYRAFDLRSFE